MNDSPSFDGLLIRHQFYTKLGYLRYTKTILVSLETTGLTNIWVRQFELSFHQTDYSGHSGGIMIAFGLSVPDPTECARSDGNWFRSSVLEIQ